MVLTGIRGFGVACLLSLVGTPAFAAAITITVNTNWSAINTGTGAGGQPSTGDTILVKNGATLTVDVANGQVGTITLGGAAPLAGQGTLAFAVGGAGQATITGNLTL